MIRKILNAASWLSLVQIMNTLSVLVLSIVVIRRADPSEVSSYMYAVFLTDAVMSYTLLQIAQRITLAENDRSFKQLFAYSRRFGMGNSAIALLLVAGVLLFSSQASEVHAIHFIAWLAVAGIANYFAQIYFSLCDYTFEYRSFGVSSSISNIASLVIAVTVFVSSGGIFSMVVRDVARALILLFLALRSARRLTPELKKTVPLDRKSKLGFIGFLVKRHMLKVIEVSNHRVPALVMTVGSAASLGPFGIAFQFISQIMSVLTIVSDKVAYSFFSRGGPQGRSCYLLSVIAINACVGLVIFLAGGKLFSQIYGSRWAASSATFSYLGLYLFTHASLVVATNFLITVERFAGVYIAWGGWTVTFVTCYLIDRSWPIVSYYLISSAVSFVLVVFALLDYLLRGRTDPLSRSPAALGLGGPSL